MVKTANLEQTNENATLYTYFFEWKALAEWPIEICHFIKNARIPLICISLRCNNYTFQADSDVPIVGHVSMSDANIAHTQLSIPTLNLADCAWLRRKRIWHVTCCIRSRYKWKRSAIIALTCIYNRQLQCSYNLYSRNNPMSHSNSCADCIQWFCVKALVITPHLVIYRKRSKRKELRWLNKEIFSLIIISRVKVAIS